MVRYTWKALPIGGCLDYRVLKLAHMQRVEFDQPKSQDDSQFNRTSKSTPPGGYIGP